jgi:retinoid hydroxylase
MNQQVNHEREIAALPIPPGSKGWPVLGETLSFLRDSQFVQKRHQRYGPVFRTHMMGQPTIILKGAEANQFILTHENQYFEVQWPPSTKVLLGNSLAMQMGAAHQGRRKLLAQAFMPRALSGYLSAMMQITESYTKRWAQEGTLTWYPELRKYTLDVACKLLVGLDNGASTPLGHLFETWCDGLFSIAVDLPWTKFGRAKRCRDLLRQEIATLITTRQQSVESGEDALGLLLQAEDEDGTRLDVDELQDQILLLLFAGHETLTSSLSTFCLQTAQHSDILSRLRAEQQHYKDEPLTLDTLKQMTYLEQVLKEVLRFTPPVGGVFRKILQTCTYGGYQLPKGWSVLGQIASTHTNPDYYPNPDAFDPDRFSPEALAKPPKYGYIPFGGGLRECLGKEFARLEMKLFAVHLLRGYQWTLLPNQNLELMVIPTPSPRDGLKVNFQKWPQQKQ